MGGRCSATSAAATATFVVSCPSQRTALLAQRPTAQRDTVDGRRRCARRCCRGSRRARRARRRAAAPPPQAGGADDLLVVTGVAHVLAVLEAVEDGLLRGVAAVEPYLCDGGCFGSPLLAEDAHVAAWRWAAVGGDAPGRERPQLRARAPVPRRARASASTRDMARRHPQARRAATPRPGRCPAETAASAARPPAPPSPKTSSWSAPRARSARTSRPEEESAT